MLKGFICHLNVIALKLGPSAGGCCPVLKRKCLCIVAVSERAFAACVCLLVGCAVETRSQSTEQNARMHHHLLRQNKVTRGKSGRWQGKLHGALFSHWSADINERELPHHRGLEGVLLCLFQCLQWHWKSQMQFVIPFNILVLYYKTTPSCLRPGNLNFNMLSNHQPHKWGYKAHLRFIGGSGLGRKFPCQILLLSLALSLEPSQPATWVYLTYNMSYI